MVLSSPHPDTMAACDIEFARSEQPFSAKAAAELDKNFSGGGAYRRAEFIIPKKVDLESHKARAGTSMKPLFALLTVPRVPE
jgi:hypothetical protein